MMKGKPNKFFIVLLSLGMIASSFLAVTSLPEANASEEIKKEIIWLPKWNSATININTNDKTLSLNPEKMDCVNINLESTKDPIITPIIIRDTVYIDRIRPFEPFMRPIVSKDNKVLINKPKGVIGL